ISTCLENHDACRAECSSRSMIPSRLIDVGLPPSYESVRLRARKEFHENPDYLTMSHCWGGAKILRLLSSNTGLFFRFIPTEQLPKTFSDAITITRRLGYRYLWIDSLCIVQNSKSDWESESAVMGEIYRGSSCTISALGAESSHDGCFTVRNPLIYRPCIIAEDSERGLVCKGRYLPQEWRGWGRSDDIDRLHSRGWVVQERILSPRTLHYGSISMSWECIEHDATELQPDG
ncbi:HET-domain-containing protein, partial [Setomelanomma holmii]